MAFQFTDANVNEIIASGRPVMIDFWATWCGPCMAMGPMIDELAEEYKDQIIIGKYNVDEESEFAGECGIRALPSFRFFKNGQMLKDKDFILSGSNRKAKLEEVIQKALAL